MRVRGFVRHRDDDSNIGIVSVGDEGLVTVQHPFVTLAHRRAARAAASEPEPGSVSPQAPRHSPVASLGMYLRLLLFVAGNENVIRAQRVMRSNDDANRAVDRDSSSIDRHVLDIAHARAARSTGKMTPIKPSLPSCFTTSAGNSLASSHRMTLGAISRWAKSRTIFTQMLLLIGEFERIGVYVLHCRLRRHE